MQVRQLRLTGAAAIAAAIVGVAILAGTAFAATDETTGTLDHATYCVGYGYGNSAAGVGVVAGTSQTGGAGPCYRKQDAFIHYNTTSNYDPANTGYQTYNLYQSAGPEGTCDYESTHHWMSWTSGDTGAPHGWTSASDC